MRKPALFRLVLLPASVAFVAAALPAHVVCRAACEGQVAASSAGQAEPSSADARAARVERGLLPGIVVAGRPLAPSSIAERMAALKVPGVSVAVIDDGEVRWAKGYGVHEAGSAAPVTPKTLFQAASISKPPTAMAALRLVEQGRLALDQNVNERLKTWTVPENEFTATEKVTLRRLLSHTAGLTVSGFPGYVADAQAPSVVQVLDGEKPANTGPIRADVVPGTISRYSGGGFTVAQLLLMDVTGRPFPELMADLVLRPTGMRDSTYEQPLPAARRSVAATGHDSDGRPIPGRYHTYPEMAAAGLWTTPTDLARFFIEIQKARGGRSSVLSADMARRMTTIERAGYGLGLGISGLGRGATFGHGGSNAGFKCQAVAFFDTGQGAVIMTNGDRGSRLAQEILHAIAREYGWAALQPRERRAVAVAPDALAGLTGRYELRPGHTIVVALDGAALIAIDRDQRIELFPESDTRFFELVEETSLEFVKGADGKVTHLMIDGRIKAPRVGDK